MPTTEKDKVQFIQFHQPALESGDYHLKLEQTIDDDGDKITAKTYTRELTFTVQGERFGPLSPQDIYAVFPPPESLGEHSNVLPHITVKRSTLPWERYPGTTDENLPWVILLLFRDSDFEAESDKPKPKNITLGELKAGEANIYFPNIELQLGQKPEELVTVIDIKKKYIKDILPTHDDLQYIAHVRHQISEEEHQNQLAQIDEGNNPELLGGEQATIICNRLPEPNGTSTVYLVSVEGRYTKPDFDDLGATDDDLIRFVSLASWSFDCIDPAQSFTQLLQRLNHNPYTPRLPHNDNAQAEAYLKEGCITVPHALRNGSKTVSWYHGPLGTGFNNETYDFPAKAADELLRYDSEIGMFDISYAAAWQLGRMLMLQNQAVAVELFNWKRQNAQYLQQLESSVINMLFPSSESLARGIPESIYNYFKGLELLQGIPFNYLVPDERLLPPESIRFFWVDSLWVDCLQDGAFSIGRVTNTSVEQDRQIRASRNLTRSVEQKITGIIIRSQVVSGWPGLLVDGYDTAVKDLDSIDPTEGNLLPLLRMETLAKDVLICLFAGEVKTVDIHLKPESMHFGLDAPTDDSPQWSKNLRDEEGELMDEFLISSIPWSNEAKEVVNLEDLAQQMNEYLELDEFTSGQFGLQMIEGVQKVRFVMQEN